MTSVNGLGAGLVELRRQRGRTAAAVAEQAGITKGMLSSYENEKVEPSLASLQKILGALGAGLGDLERAMARSQGSREPSLGSWIEMGELGPAERALLADRLQAFLEALLHVVVPAVRGPELEPTPKGKTET